MPTITIRKTWTVGGLPANPDSISLRDPTGSYGIRRDDTGAIVVAAGTPLAPSALGVFEYTVTGVDAGTTYTAWIEVVSGGQTTYLDVTTVPSLDAPVVSYPDGLKTILDQLTALYVQITLQPKPTYNVEGNHYRWTEYHELLGKQIEQLTRLLAQAYPFEIVSRG